MTKLPQFHQLIAIWGKSVTKALNLPLFASSQLQRGNAGRKGSEKSTLRAQICWRQGGDKDFKDYNRRELVFLSKMIYSQPR